MQSLTPKYEEPLLALSSLFRALRDRGSNGWSLQTGTKESFSTSLLFSFLSYRISGDCSPMVCGANHNETMMFDRL